ncbi:MAG: FmdB family transcriptional regulator [Kocuria rhizophila]|nr:FmdB family transcriptional regulator [Kocuria rhizophila]
MPVYAYACKDCGHAFDIRQSFTDDALTVCPECGGHLRKKFNSVGVVFKGSGFYHNDSRADAGKNGGSSSGAASGSASSGSGDGASSGGSASSGSASSGASKDSGTSGGSASSSSTPTSSTGSGSSTSGS